jgi:hypothetical protein
VSGRSHRRCAKPYNVSSPYQVYTTLLALVLLKKPISQTRTISAHATLVTLAIFAALAYRNVWPMLTFIYAPADHVSRLLWTKLALSGIAGIVIPLYEPFPYIPLDPSVRSVFVPRVQRPSSLTLQRPQEAINPEQVRPPRFLPSQAQADARTDRPSRQGP